VVPDVADLEGYLDDADGRLYPIARDGTDRPVLLLGTAGFRNADLVRSWSALRRRSPLSRWEELPGTMHWALTDYAAMVPQLQAAGLITPAGREAMIGAAPEAYSVPAVRFALGRFFR
jgi:hypothetical protein